MTRRHPVLQSRWLLCVLALGALAAVPAARAQEEADPATTVPDDRADAEPTNHELFGNFLHFAILGRFELADQHARKLLENNPDPQEVLTYADEYTNSLKTLVLLVSKAGVSESARQVLALIHEGELAQRRDPQRIRANIEKLGGDPQTEFNAINRLRESGEYAVPWLIATLQDASKERLHNRIIRMLPKIGKKAVNPLVIALRAENPQTRQFVARALGEIGYPQALPYLLLALQAPDVSPELRTTIEIAMARIVSDNPAASASSASAAFLELAKQYYADHGSVKADPRDESANVWYWREGRLQRTEVPREIFNEIMVMRCCEEALRLEPAREVAVAYWLAGNIRREAELGLDVESVEADEAALADPTKIDTFPRSGYFARAAGARYCHMVVDLAVAAREPAVALGAIAALRLIAGPSNLVGAEDYKQPLVQALTFPDQVVRMKAALALAHALPAQRFAGSDRVVPLLAETLAQTGGRHLLVVDPDEANRNRVMDALRNDDTMVIGSAGLYDGLEQARLQMPSISAFFIAGDTPATGLGGALDVLRSNNAYAMTPVIMMTKQGQTEEAERLAQGDRAATSVAAFAEPRELRTSWLTVARRSGHTALGSAEALALALDAAAALRKIAYSGSQVYDFSMAEGALIDALNREPEVLQTTAASVLALSSNSAAQQAVATVALDESRSESLRVAAFEALAESAKFHGNMISEDLVDRLIDLAVNEPNLTLRSAGSQALGALDIPSNKASQIIENFYSG